MASDMITVVIKDTFYLQTLRRMYACPAAYSWVIRKTDGTAQDAWDKCPRYDWAFWMICYLVEHKITGISRYRKMYRELLRLCMGVSRLPAGTYVPSSYFEVYYLGNSTKLYSAGGPATEALDLYWNRATSVFQGPYNTAHSKKLMKFNEDALKIIKKHYPKHPKISI